MWLLISNKNNRGGWGGRSGPPSPGGPPSSLRVLPDPRAAWAGRRAPRGRWCRGRGRGARVRELSGRPRPRRAVPPPPAPPPPLALRLWGGRAGWRALRRPRLLLPRAILLRSEGEEEPPRRLKARSGEPEEAATARARAFLDRGDLEGRRDRLGGGLESRACRAARPFPSPAP